MKSLEHNHSFNYEITHSEVDGVIPHKVSVGVDGDVDLYEILEKFETYLVACGYVLPHNTYVGLVPKE